VIATLLVTIDGQKFNGMIIYHVILIAMTSNPQKNNISIAGSFGVNDY